MRCVCLVGQSEEWGGVFEFHDPGNCMLAIVICSAAIESPNRDGEQGERECHPLHPRSAYGMCGRVMGLDPGGTLGARFFLARRDRGERRSAPNQSGDKSPHSIKDRWLTATESALRASKRAMPNLRAGAATAFG